MGSKRNPGQFDCYAAAAPDEPMFVLLGRDRHAAFLTRLWGLLRARDGEDAEKIEEAFACADAMDAHARLVGKNPVALEFIFEPILMAASNPLQEHPCGYEHACDCFECRSCD